ncbi:hypothetical protein [Mycoavidus sp. SF9855]|uniref:hypothetical protein n=1 Tax=Mycoavidus sp. SF9855 TaxID=2968475 RepID=UPI00211C7889|nr:hypothetical protein [Mycoavidus sp. SF9855]UUM22094.1 hypothetical protein NQD60_03130 [Mycoavidus sp. SF9855]
MIETAMNLREEFMTVAKHFELEGWKKGWKEGWHEGWQKAKRETVVETANNMLAAGMQPGKIKEIMRLSDRDSEELIVNHVITPE